MEVKMPEQEARVSGWYIESWASLDGLVFATEHDEQGDVNTVFLSPPYWSAVAVSNRATAWAAARASFQDGYFTAGGEEIRFNTLDEIREIARRGYLTGGYGLLPPTNNDDAPVLRRGGDGFNEPEGWSGVSESIGNVITDTDRMQLSNALVGVFAHRSGWDAYESILDDFAASTLGMYERMFAKGSTNRNERSDFNALLRTGSTVFGFERIYRWWHDVGLHPYYDYGWRGDSGSSLSAVMQLVFRLPVARGRRLETLGDHLVLAGSSREYFRSMHSSLDLLPVMVGALFICGSNDVLSARRWVAGNHLEEACAWIAANVPSVLATDHPAALEMEKFVSKIRAGGPESVRSAVHVAVAEM